MILSLALATGCVQKIKNPSGQLVIGVESEIKNLDMRTANDANAWHVATLISQGLVRVNDDFLPETDLAESFEVSADGKEYLFRLPPQARFHDGSPLTSDDVKATFEKGIADRGLSGFKDVERYEAPDPLTFKVRLKIPRASFLVSELSMIRIMPKTQIDNPEFGSHPVGSGPYQFVERKHRDLVLKRFEGYRFNRSRPDDPLPSFEKIIVRTVEDSITRYLSLMGGDVDVLLNALPARKIVEGLKSPRIQVVRSPGSTYTYLGFNFRLKKFQDVRVRRALAMAIDREEIRLHKMLGYARLAQSIVPPSNFYHNDNIPQIPYDPEGAKRLLKQAGVKNLEVEIKTSTDRDVASNMLIIKNNWEKIGVKVTLRPAEFATFFADVQKGNFEIFPLRWTAVTDPDQMYKTFHSKEVPPGKNRGYYSNKVLDGLLERAQSEMNIEARKKLYAKAQEIVAEDLPYISLFYPDNSIVASSRLKEVRAHSTGAWAKIIYAKKDEAQ